MQMLGEACTALHVERTPIIGIRSRQDVGERLEALCERLQTFEDQAAVDRTKNSQVPIVCLPACCCGATDFRWVQKSGSSSCRSLAHTTQLLPVKYAFQLSRLSVRLIGQRRFQVQFPGCFYCCSAASTGLTHSRNKPKTHRGSHPHRGCSGTGCFSHGILRGSKPEDTFLVHDGAVHHVQIANELQHAGRAIDTSSCGQWAPFCIVHFNHPHSLSLT